MTYCLQFDNSEIARNNLIYKQFMVIFFGCFDVDNFAQYAFCFMLHVFSCLSNFKSKKSSKLSKFNVNCIFIKHKNIMIKKRFHYTTWLNSFSIKFPNKAYDFRLSIFCFIKSLQLTNHTSFPKLCLCAKPKSRINLLTHLIILSIKSFLKENIVKI